MFFHQCVEIDITVVGAFFDILSESANEQPTKTDSNGKIKSEAKKKQQRTNC